MRIIQAFWPFLLLTVYAIGLFTQRDWAILPAVILLLAWVICAFLLNPARSWSWWVCLAPVGLYTLAGLACIFAIVHMIVFPNHSIWAEMNQPGAMFLLLAFVFLVPGSLLLCHLFAVRRRFFQRKFDRTRRGDGR